MCKITHLKSVLKSKQCYSEPVISFSPRLSVTAIGASALTMLKMSILFLFSNYNLEVEEQRT